MTCHPEDLIDAIVLRAPGLSKWEQEFMVGVERTHAKSGCLSPKQIAVMERMTANLLPEPEPSR